MTNNAGVSVCLCVCVCVGESVGTSARFLCHTETVAKMNEQKEGLKRVPLAFVSTECVYAHNCILYLLREMFQMKIRISMCQPSLLPLPLHAPNGGIFERVLVSEKQPERNPARNSTREMCL